MKKRTLGRTGLQVSELGLGLGGLFSSQTDAGLKQGIATVRRAINQGISAIDMAAAYYGSEAGLGQALEGIIQTSNEQPLVLTTKLGRRIKEEKVQPFDPKDKADLRSCLETSLRLLRRETIDILMIHEPDRPLQYDWWDDYINVCGPVLEALADFKREGKIRFTGLGGTTAYEIVPLMRSEHFDVVLTAFNYSLLWREAEHAVIPTARELNLGLVIGSPLQQGALARRFDKEIETAWWLSPPRRAQFQALYSFLDEIQLPITEAALRFVLSNSNVSTVLMGARSPEEVDTNIAAAKKGPLSAGVLQRLNEIAAMVPFRPFEEPFGLPLGGSYTGPGMAGR